MDRPFLTVVSGIPRSGTSLMMRMLEAGGHAGLTDRVRGADVDNPRGYYEYEAVKTLKQDASWVAGSCGKAVKMVYLLVYDLPPDVEYRIIFMHRNIEEMLASQKAMLDRLGKSSTIPDAKMAALFGNHLVKFAAWAKERPNIQRAGCELQRDGCRSGPDRRRHQCTSSVAGSTRRHGSSS